MSECRAEYSLLRLAAGVQIQYSLTSNRRKTWWLPKPPSALHTSSCSNIVSSDATEQRKVIDFIHISTAIANEGNMSKSSTDTFFGS